MSKKFIFITILLATIFSCALCVSAVSENQHTSAAVVAQVIPEEMFNEIYSENMDVDLLVQIRSCIENKMMDPFMDIEYLLGFYTRLCIPSADEKVSAQEFINSQLSRYDAAGYNMAGIKDMKNFPEEAILLVYMPGADDAALLCGSAVREILTDEDIAAVETVIERSKGEIYELIHRGAKELIMRLFDDEKQSYPQYSYVSEYLQYSDKAPDMDIGVAVKQPFFPELNGEQRCTLSYLIRKIYKYSGIQLLTTVYDKENFETPEIAAEELAKLYKKQCAALEYVGAGNKIITVAYSSDENLAAIAGNGISGLFSEEDEKNIIYAFLSGGKNTYKSVYSGISALANVIFENGKYSCPQDPVFDNFLKTKPEQINLELIAAAIFAGTVILAAILFFVIRTQRERLYNLRQKFSAQKIEYLNKMDRIKSKSFSAFRIKIKKVSEYFEKTK